MFKFAILLLACYQNISDFLLSKYINITNQGVITSLEVHATLAAR